MQQYNFTTTSPRQRMATSIQAIQPQTFHFYENLPLELQIQILEYTVDVPDLTCIAMLNKQSILLLVARHLPPRYFRIKSGYEWADGHPRLGLLRAYRTRNALLATYRLSRLLALKAWKADIEGFMGCEFCTTLVAAAGFVLRRLRKRWSRHRIDLSRRFAGVCRARPRRLG